MLNPALFSPNQVQISSLLVVFGLWVPMPLHLALEKCILHPANMAAKAFMDCVAHIDLQTPSPSPPPPPPPQPWEDTVQVDSSGSDCEKFSPFFGYVDML